MNTHEKDELVAIAGAVSDGMPVDWEREKAKSPGLRPALEHLAVLERIRDVHRGPAGGRDDGDDRDAAAMSAAAATTATAETEPQGMGTTDPASPPLSTWGTLRILEKVGEGGWGEVYRAFDPSLETDVAVKLLKPGMAGTAAAVESFISEARRLARVRHANVLVVHGADRHEGRAGIWSELIRGESLEEHIRREGPMSAQEAALVGLDLCRALSAMHAARLIHRDVKASNVMREKGGRTVLMDFGSVAEAPRPGTTGWTQHIHGTPVCMAPEQLRGEVAGPATDVYGLGVLLYHLVSREYPVQAQSREELARAHAERRYIPLRDRRADIPLGFVRVVERAIEHDPASRYSSAGAMERALAATLENGKPSWLRWAESHGGALAAAAAVVVVAVALGVFSTMGRPPQSPEVPAARPAPLTAVVQLQRRTGETETPVPEGGALKPGDELSMLVTPDERMHVYVLNEDRRGNVFVLFPVPGVSVKNPLEAFRMYRLPGSTEGDSSAHWDVTSPGGLETILAIGVRTALPEIDSVLAMLPQAQWGQPVQIAPEALQRLRGIGGLSTGPPAAPPENRRWVETLEGRLRERRERQGDVWIWKILLQNPVPEP